MDKDNCHRYLISFLRNNGCDIKNCTKCKIRKYCKGLEDNTFEPYDCGDVLKIYIKDKENNK